MKKRILFLVVSEVVENNCNLAHVFPKNIGQIKWSLYKANEMNELSQSISAGHIRGQSGDFCIDQYSLLLNDMNDADVIVTSKFGVEFIRKVVKKRPKRFVNMSDHMSFPAGEVQPYEMARICEEMKRVFIDKVGVRKSFTNGGVRRELERKTNADKAG